MVKEPVQDGIPEAYHKIERNFLKPCVVEAWWMEPGTRAVLYNVFSLYCI